MTGSRVSVGLDVVQERRSTNSGVEFTPGVSQESAEPESSVVLASCKRLEGKISCGGVRARVVATRRRIDRFGVSQKSKANAIERN
jgi:hypothetical protein